MISLDNVGVMIQGKTLLSSVQAALPANSLTAIIGPNGAGKSTLLNVMAGGMVPTTGEVCFDGQRMGNFRPDKLAQRRAVLSQNLELLFPISGQEVVALGRSLKNESGSRQQQIVQAALRRAQACDLSDRMFNTLSGGERQRIHFARVLAQLWEPIETGMPAMLLLDEPTSAMDMNYQQILLSQLKQLVAGGLTVCCVLHDLNLAAMFADNLWVIKQGRLIAEGNVATVFDGDTLSEIYDTPLMTISHPQQAGGRVVFYGVAGAG